LQEKLNKEFETVRLNTEIVSIRESGKSGYVTMATAEETIEESFDRILVSVGRRPNTDKIGLEHTKVELDDKGFVKVDFKRQTSDSAILAIGDVSGEPMLAHKASHEARIGIDGLDGKDVTFDNRVIPAVVFTDPEIAWCGLTESEARRKSLDVEVARFPWRASGRAHTLGQ
jgi:dihydrolipoamide dehydrogenase